MTRDELLQRIVAGAEYIESIGPGHPKYDAAMKRYDELVQELMNLDKPEYYLLDERVLYWQQRAREILSRKDDRRERKAK
mgnify:CR=1 FL=1